MFSRVFFTVMGIHPFGENFEMVLEVKQMGWNMVKQKLTLMDRTILALVFIFICIGLAITFLMRPFRRVTSYTNQHK